MNAFPREAMTEGEALCYLVDRFAAEDGVAMKAVETRFRHGGYRRVAFAGMGSSYRAPFAVLDRLAAAGIPAIAVTARKLAADRAALAGTDTMIVAISKSGGTTEVLDLVDAIGEHAGLVALVNQPESALAKRCEMVLPMRAGSESQVASKSYLCTLAVPHLLAAELIGEPPRERLDQLRGIGRWASTYLAAATRTEPNMAAALEPLTHVDVLGSGASFSTAYKSALVLREVPRLIASAIDCADYAHGWSKIVRPGYAGIVLAPKYQNHSAEALAIGQILERGGSAILVTSSPVPAREQMTVLRHPALPEHLAPLARAVVCDALIGAMADLGER
jgi:glutamine---fructose-6-phosphate transaminase (isomerizing)